MTANQRLTPEELAEYRDLLPLGRFVGVGGDALKSLLDEIEACWAERKTTAPIVWPKCTVCAALLASGNEHRQMLCDLHMRPSETQPDASKTVTFVECVGENGFIAIIHRDRTCSVHGDATTQVNGSDKP